MVGSFAPPPDKAFKPMHTILLQDFSLPAGARHTTEQMHVPVLNIGLRIVSSDEITVFIEEFNGAEWLVCDTTPTLPGETVCNHWLKNPDFRIAVLNPSETKDQTVTVQIKWIAPEDYEEDRK